MIIFIAGAHAVGKSYLCKNNIKANKLLHKSCSQIIQETKEKSWNDDKLVHDIEKNQIILLTELEKIRSSEHNLLLDGHFVLVSNEGNYTPIEHHIFEKMAIDAILLIETEAEIISERFKHRGAKLTFIPNKLMEEERKNAKLIAIKLNIPIKILTSPTQEEFDITVERLIKNFI